MSCFPYVHRLDARFCLLCAGDYLDAIEDRDLFYRRWELAGALISRSVDGKLGNARSAFLIPDSSAVGELNFPPITGSESSGKYSGTISADDNVLSDVGFFHYYSPFKCMLKKL